MKFCHIQLQTYIFYGLNVSPKDETRGQFSANMNTFVVCKGICTFNELLKVAGLDVKSKRVFLKAMLEVMGLLPLNLS